MQQDIDNTVQESEKHRQSLPADAALSTANRRKYPDSRTPAKQYAKKRFNRSFQSTLPRSDAKHKVLRHDATGLTSGFLFRVR